MQVILGAPRLSNPVVSGETTQSHVDGAPACEALMLNFTKISSLSKLILMALDHIGVGKFKDNAQ